MINQKKLCFVAICMIMACVLFVSCGQKPGEKMEETEVIFSEAVIPIKMIVPSNWTIDDSYYSSNNSYYSTESTSTIRIDNSLKESIQGDKGLSFTLESPFYIGDKNVETIIPDFETFQKQKCGNNDIYISIPPQTGYIYFDGKYIIRIQIEHWPKNGITPEMESFFSSLHVD